MPIVISVPKDIKLIELQEFIDVIEENKYDLNTKDELFILAKLLNQLNNNKQFLINHIANELANLSAFQKSNVYDNKTFVLHQTKNYLLRAVVWTPGNKSIENPKFDIYHDHNFDLLTAGYFGPGYKTRALTYNEKDIVGLLDEEVVVEDKGIFTLSEGQIMFYQAKKDIHSQIPPESMSVSINVIPGRNVINRPQFEFDKDSFKISRYLQLSSNELVIRLAGLLGDENDIEILKTIIVKHNNPHIKAYAALAITQISPELSEDMDRLIYGSKNKLMIDIFNRERSVYGSCL